MCTFQRCGVPNNNAVCGHVTGIVSGREGTGTYRVISLRSLNSKLVDLHVAHLEVVGVRVNDGGMGRVSQGLYGVVVLLLLFRSLSLYLSLSIYLSPPCVRWLCGRLTSQV